MTNSTTSSAPATSSPIQAGGTNTDTGSAVALDNNGNVYLAGNFVGSAHFGNTDVASIDPAGLLTSLRRGEAPVLARYEGAVVLVTHDEEAVESLRPERVLLLPDGVEDAWRGELADLVALS